MQLPKDLLSETYQVPDVILCQTNKEKICKLNTINLEGTFKFNSYSEISFDVPSVYCDLITGETKPTPYYNYVEGLRLVYLEGFGYFQLQDPEINGDGIQEYKHINAYSLEYALSQRYLETFIINKGDVGDTIGSIDGVVLYNKNDVEHSLLNLALQKAYGWTVGHVDEELMTQSRSFEIDRQSIYDFIMNDICDTFKCYVEFDTINNTVNLYSENEIERHIGDGEKKIFELKNALSDTSIITINGHTITQYTYNPMTNELTFPIIPAKDDIIEVADEFKHKYDTDVIIAFENLSNEIKINYSADDIKTVLTVKGADDLDICDVNFGLPSIMNLDYYCTPEWMGEKLYNEYQLYVDKQNKYMSGFYSKDIAGSTEESFNVVADSENFIAGNVQKLSVNMATEAFNVSGYVPSFNIDKTTKEFNIVIKIKQYNDIGNTDIFTEPIMQEEEILCEDPHVESIKVQDSEKNTFQIESVITSLSKITLNQRELLETEYEYQEESSTLVINVQLNVDDEIKIFTYKNVFKPTYPLTDNSVVYFNGEEITFNYNKETSELSINRQVTSQDIIKIYTPTGDIVSNFTLSKPENKILSVKINNIAVDSNSYIISSDGKTITIIDVSLLKYGSEIVIESVLNKFSLQDLNDKIVSIKIDDQETDRYTLNETNLIITDNRLGVNSIVSIESIDTHFDLSAHRDKQIVSVSVGENVLRVESQYQFDADTGILTITDYELSSGDTIIVKLVNNSFVISIQDYKILSVKIDSNKVSYEFDPNTSVLTIAALDSLFAGEQVLVELIDKYFILNQTKNKIITVLVDGYEINKDEFSYEDNKLVITADTLTTQSNIVVESIDTSFSVKPFYGTIDSVWIDNTETEEYIFDEVKNILTINDSRLLSNSKVLFKTIYNRFYLSNTQKVLTNVMVNGVPTENYTFASDVLIIQDELHVGDSIVVELIDNHFTVLNKVGSRHVVEVQSETIPEGKDGYEYDSSTQVLTIYVPLKNGDKVSIKTIDSADALLVVDSNAGDGEILKEDVTPTLMSYEPKAGDYVVKVNSYTESLKQLYDLISQRLNAENSIPSEYEVIEIRLNPDNVNQSGNSLPEAKIEYLGEVYKIINQDKIKKEDGTIIYNDIAYKYYVCEMKYSSDQYKYIWVERDLVFGETGIKYLEEKKDIYSAIQDIQIAAGWDQKPEDSVDYQNYKINFEKLQQVKTALKNQEETINAIAEQIKIAQEKIQLIAEDVAVDKNFTSESLERLSLFLREDEYSDDCFCVTEIDTDLDKINTQKELLIAGQKELKNLSKPKLSFSASMKNIYAMPEFQPILHQFNLGNFIKVRMRKDFIKKARLLEVQLNFSDLSNFSCTFGDLLSAKDQGDIHADLLSQAVSAGKAVASGSSYWQKGYDVATAIDEKIRRGLIDATTSIKSNSAGQDVSWDNYGIHLRKFVGDDLDPHEGWITNNKFLYSDDNFKTTKSVFGNYTIDKTEYWGVLAGCVSAGLIEGSTIVGGTIKIGAQVDEHGSPILDEEGNQIYNFEVDSDGAVTMNKGEAAEKLSYFSFDGDNGLIVGENKDGEYFSRVSAQRIEFCRKANITEVTSEPTQAMPNCDYILYTHTEGSDTYFDYYKNPDFVYKSEEPLYEARAINENFVDPEVKFGIPITYFANDTAYMKQAEIEGDLRVGTESAVPSISLGNFKLQIESNGSLSIIAIQ